MNLGLKKTFTLKGADSAGNFHCLIFVIVYCLISVQVNRLFLFFLFFFFLFDSLRPINNLTVI